MSKRSVVFLKGTNYNKYWWGYIHLPGREYPRVWIRRKKSPQSGSLYSFRYRWIGYKEPVTRGHPIYFRHQVLPWLFKQGILQAVGK